MHASLRTLVTSALPVAFVACADAAPRLATPEITTRPGGIVEVANTGPTAWRGTAGWTLERERVIAPAQGSDGELVNPRQVIADSRGRLYVLDSRPSIIKVFGPDGSYERSFAPEGGGPGEISERALLMISRDTLVVHDIIQSRASTWNADGAMLGLWTSLCCMGVNSWADDSGRYPVPAIVYPLAQGASPFSALGFVRFTSNGTATDTLRYPDSGIETKSWMTQGKPIPIPMQPADRMAIAPSGVVVAGHQSRYRIAITRNGRDTLRVFTAPTETRRIPDADRQEALDAMIRRIPGLGAIARLDDLPTVYSPWDDLRIDGLGNIWVMASGPRGARDHWDVFSAEGVLLGAVSAPFDEIQRTHWGKDRVYVVVEDETTGLPSVEVWRINRGSPGAS